MPGRVPVLFVVCGRSAELKSSVRVIGRYKDLSEEIQDVFIDGRVTRAARRSMLVFRAAPKDEPSAWVLVSFDMAKWVPKKDGSGLRKRTAEYSRIRDAALWSLCARIDNSTYLCPEMPDALISYIRRYTDRIEVWYVVFDNEMTRERVAELVAAAVRALAIRIMAARMKRAYGAAKKRREAKHSRVLETLRRVRSKLVELIGEEPVEELEELITEL